jgi:predicted enzyme related to lactoylglutathione lyase
MLPGPSYFEIQAQDPERVIAFYTAVFGWQFEKTPAPAPVAYWHIKTGSLPGGLVGAPAPRPPQACGTNAYTCSVEVPDFDAVAASILAHGGAVAMPKFAIPGRLWQGYFLDPEGNVFGVNQLDSNAGR